MYWFLPNSAVTVFNLGFSLCTFHDCCNASQSVFSIGAGALNTLIVIVIVEPVLSPGFGARRRKKRRENNLTFAHEDIVKFM